MGLIFQEFELLEYLSVLDNVLLPFRVSSVLKINNEVVENAKQLCSEVGLGSKLNRYPGYLSQGERQRVAVCRALVTNPVLLLCDEPTGNLDSRSGEEIMALLHTLHESGRTIVMVTHDSSIARHTERAIHLLDGKIEKIVQNGSAHEQSQTIEVQHESA